MTRTNDRGAAVVEFALVMPILFLVIFAIIDFGRAYFTTSSLSHAAREGVRVVALGDTAGTAVARATQAASPMTITAHVEDAGVTTATDYTCTFGSPTTLVAEKDFSYLTPLGGFIAMITGEATTGFGDTTLRSEASMRCGG